MKEFLSKKAAGTYFIAVSAILSIVAVIIYTTFTSTYNIFDSVALVCLIVAILAEVVAIVFDTRFDAYVQLAIVVLLSVAFSLYLEDCVGTINDYLNDVSFMGSGAPIEKVFALAGLMLFTVLLNIIGCFLKKTK